MGAIQLMLWELVEPLAKKLGLVKDRARPGPAREGRGRTGGGRSRGAGGTRVAPSGDVGGTTSMAARYERVAREMLSKYEVRVRKWRRGTSGIAWYVAYRDGSVQRLIESPRPRGPMSMAVFLHEIGHHAIGFNVYKPRCLEEYHAWEFSLRTMRERGLNVTEAVLRRRRRSLEYAVGKACRRGIKSIPAELVEFIPARYRAGRA